MVWGFGGSGSNVPPTIPEGLTPLSLGGQSGSGGGGDEPLSKQDREKAKSLATQYRFDSAALERAAKAAKDLEKSPHAKELLDLTRTQEVTRQLELQKHNNEFAANLERVKYEEQRKNLDTQAKLAQQKAQYEDQLARLRYKDQLEEQKRAQDVKFQREQAHQEEMNRRQRESILEQEELRRRTIDYELSKKTERDMKRIQAKYKSLAVYERENKDVHQEQIRLQAEEKRHTTIDTIEKLGSVIGQGFMKFISDSKTVTATALGLTMLAGGIYGARQSVSIIGKTIESRIGKPTLFRDTSRLNAIDLFKHPILTAARIQASRRPQDALKDVILPPSLEEKLRNVAIATRNTKLNKSSYRNFMFYGPPGTGKTLFAQKLAQHSGMDYAIVSGGDVGPMGREAVTALHKVFDWANTSRRGLILFIDEAEGFLSERRTGKMSEGLKQVVDTFLQRTGSQSNKFMLILSTNIPEQIDMSVEDRIDEDIKFDLPTLDERKRLVALYFEKDILVPASYARRRGLKVEKFDYVSACDRVADMTNGLSGRAIAKLGPAWRHDAFATANRTLTEKMMFERVDEIIAQFKERQKRRSLSIC